MSRNRKTILKWLFMAFLIIQSYTLFAQEAEEVIPETVTEELVAKPSGQFHMFLNNNLIFALSLENGGFGFGGTVTFEYKTPFYFTFALESGFYGAKSEINQDFNTIVGGFSLIPMYAVVGFDIPILENFYVSPIIKGGVAYTSARVNGWFGGSAFSGVFEGGIRVKAFLGGGFLLQANVTYIGLIESSGIISMISVGFGFGF